MVSKKPDLDKTTVDIIKRVLAMPPKPHEAMRVGRPAAKKKRSPKGRASFAKPPSV
jgi:hypothetical protein